MKKLLYLLLFTFFQQTLNAQIINKLSIELNLGRYSKEPGLFESDYYSHTISYLNGFNLGYSATEKWQYYIGFRRLNATLDPIGGFSYESSTVKGAELKVGAKFSPKSHQRVFLSYGLEVFEEFSGHEGTYWVDYPPDYDINHRKNFFGIAPNLGINVRLADRIVFFADTRARFGRVILGHKGSSKSGKDLFQVREYWTSVYEPLNSVGVRFKL